MVSYAEDLRILCDKVEGLDDRSWDELCCELNCDLHPDSLRKSFAVGDYSGYKVYKYFESIIDKQYAEEDFKRLEKLRADIYKEKVKLQDNRRLINRDLREEARYENLVDVLKEEITNLPKLKVKPCDIKFGSGVEASLIISDIHYGLEIDNVSNYYNCEISKQRLEELCNKVIEYSRKNLVQRLHLFLTGDLINGIIKIQHRIDAEEDVISQILGIGELLSQFIVKIQENVPEIKIYGIIGNHSRVTPNKKESKNSENFERLVFNHIKLRTGLNVITNGLEDWLLCKVKNKTIFVSHGNNDNIGNVKTHCINVTNTIPDICYLGHYHHFSINDDNNCEIIVNGSLVSTDDYAMSLRLNTKPYQVMQLFNNDDTQIIKICVK